jgi:capsular polysaccharide biosynthesis protein
LAPTATGASVRCVESATLTPAWFDPGRHLMKGAVYDRDLELVRESQRPVQRLWRSRDPTHIKEVHARATLGEAVYLGYLFTHFGHFLVETLPALHWAQIHDGPCLFYPWGSAKEADRDRSPMRECLKALSIDPGRIVLVNRPLHVDRLLMPPLGNAVNAEPNPELLGVYHDVAERLCERWQDQGARRVYVSRRLWSKRQTSNEDEVELEFSRHGFRLSYPEQMSFAEQVNLVRHADVLAGMSGSALHLSGFMHAGARVYALSSRGMPALNAITRALGIRTVRLDVAEAVSERERRHYEVDIEALRTALERQWL